MTQINNYSFLRYNYIERWISYWHQISEVVKLSPSVILEIGPANKFVTNYLRDLSFNVTTIDIDEKNKPDVIGSVLKMPFDENKFNLIICCEVLEHIPFENFTVALAELHRVSGKYLLLSLPHWGWLFYLKIKVPFFGEKKIYFKLSGFIKHPPGGVHFWEIGKKGFPLGLIKNKIISQNFKILNDYIDPDSSYHHFFILEKI